MDVTIWIEPSLGLSITKTMESGSTIAMLKEALVADDVLGSLSVQDIVLVAKGRRSEALADEWPLSEELLELEFGSLEELSAAAPAEVGQPPPEAQWQGEAQAWQPAAHEEQWHEGAQEGSWQEAPQEGHWQEGAPGEQWQQEARSGEEGQHWEQEEDERRRAAEEAAAWEAEEKRRREEEQARQWREWQEWTEQEEARRKKEEEAARQRREQEDEEERERQRRAKKRAEEAEKRRAEEEVRRKQREEEERERRKRAEELAEVERKRREAEQKATQSMQNARNTAAGARKLLGNPLQYKVVMESPAYAEPFAQASKSPLVPKGTWVLGFPGSAAWVMLDRRTVGLPGEAMLMREIWMPMKSQDESGGGEPILHANWSDVRAERVSDNSLDVVWPGVGQPVEPNTAEYSVDFRPKQDPPAKGTPACSGTSKTRATVGGLEKDSDVQVRVSMRIVGPYSTNFRIFGVWADLKTSGSGSELRSVNKALRRPARSSSAKSQERQANFAVDGDATTRWTSIYEDNQWLSVDLGEVCSVLRVEIRWEAAHAAHYWIQGSHDDRNWQTLATEMGREGWVMTTLPSDSVARYVRMLGRTRATQFGFSIFEMKVFALEAAGAEPEAGDAPDQALAAEEQVETEGEGVYEVVHTFVTLRAEPSTKGTIRGTIKKGWHVFGTPFRIGGQPWTKLSAQTIPPVEKSLPPRNITAAESVWALVDATGVPGLGLGELLRRVGDGASSEEMRKLGEWKVLSEKVTIREGPSAQARLVGYQRKGAKVFGVCFPIGGESWVRVQNPPGMEGPDLWLPVDGEKGQPRQLDRLRDAPEAHAKSRSAALPGSSRPHPPKPLTAAWLAAHGGLPKPPSAVREALLDADVDVGMASQCTMVCVKPADGGAELNYVAKRGSTNGDMGSCEKEYRFYSEVARRGVAAGAPQPEMLAGVVRVPRCLCANWGKEGKEREAFILILEMFGKPDWVHVDPEIGCSLEQAVTAVEALGRMHKAFSSKKVLDELSWLPTTVFDVRNAAHIQQWFSMTVEQAGALVQLLPPSAQAAVDRMAQGGFGECMVRLGEPPITLNHGDYRAENLRFSAPGQPPAVAVFDWGLVNCARGVADFAYFLMLSQPPEQRRQWEGELLQKYLQARGDYSERAMKETREDLKSASISILGMILMTRQGATHGFTQGTRIMLSRMMRWVGEAIMDWRSIDVLPL